MHKPCFSFLYNNRLQNELLFLEMALERLWIGQLSSTSESTGVVFLTCVGKSELEKRVDVSLCGLTPAQSQMDLFVDTLCT